MAASAATGLCGMKGMVARMPNGRAWSGMEGMVPRTSMMINAAIHTTESMRTIRVAIRMKLFRAARVM